MLRSQPLAAGLDPRFVVLDEAAARRLATSAFEAALEEWIAARGAPAVDLAAAYGRDARADGHAGVRHAAQPRRDAAPAQRAAAAAAPDAAALAAAAAARRRRPAARARATARA